MRVYEKDLTDADVQRIIEVVDNYNLPEWVIVTLDQLMAGRTAWDFGGADTTPRQAVISLLRWVEDWAAEERLR